jgi:S-adenosylmethionine synthetase
VSVFVNTFGTAKVESNGRRVEGSKGRMTDSEIAALVKEIFDLRPYAINQRFGLKNPIYSPTAAYGHFGRDSYEKDGMVFFGWERLDFVEKIRAVFKI